MSKVKFVHTLAAVEAREKHITLSEGSDLWAIGAALIKDIQPSVRRLTGIRQDETVERELKRAAAEMAAEGYPAYEAGYLRSIMDTTDAFPVSRRHKNLSFFVHAEAKNPDILDWIVEKAPKKQEISGRYVREMVMRWHKRVVQKTREEHQAARTKRATATTPAEREAAEREVAATALPPSKRDLPPPTGNEGISILKELDVLKNAREAKRLAAATNRDIEDAVYELDDTAVAVLAEACLAAMQAWKEVADTVRKATSNKRGHMTLVSGGAA